MPRIENDVSILWNDEIPISHFKLIGVSQDVKRYWGSNKQERTFPIPIWKVQKLFDASTSNPKSIALKVSNIDDTVNVDAEWISYPPQQMENNCSYFVLESKYFDEAEFYRDVDNNILGMKEEELAYKNVLVGRIAQRQGAPSPCVYMIIAEYKYKSGPGGGGGGATSGAKIPSEP